MCIVWLELQCLINFIFQVYLTSHYDSLIDSQYNKINILIHCLQLIKSNLISWSIAFMICKVIIPVLIFQLQNCFQRWKKKLVYVMIPLQN